jgi:hypothetical protein
MKREIFKVLIIFSLCTCVARGQSLFKDETSELGLKQLGNAAVACIDYNNDGYVDLYSNGKLWRNNEGKSFSKIRDEGEGRAVWADYDNDGYPDFYIYNDNNKQQLFWNDHDMQFVLQSFPTLLMEKSYGASWADFNGDGYVDLYIGGYNDKNIGFNQRDVRIINLTDPKQKSGRRFELDKEQTSEQQKKAQGLARGVTSCDFDEDGDIDIYVSNYGLQPNLLWLNIGKGIFKELAAHFNVVAAFELFPGGYFPGGHSIGAVWGDFNNDGLFDLFVSNFAHPKDYFRPGRPPKRQPESRFLKNLGPKKKYIFQDLGQCGIYYQESYASPAAGDYDNDGDVDLFLTTVGDPYYPGDYSVLYRNEGNWNFTNVTGAEGLYDAIHQDPLCGYQAAWFDYDRDGDLDLITDGKLFENQSNKNNWLKVHLQGDGKQVNRSAIGTQVRIKLKDRTLTRQVEAGTGEGNQNDLILHFGLGKNEGPVELEVSWPNVKEKQIIPNVDVNQQTKVTFQKSEF